MADVPRLGYEWMRTNGVVECHSLHAPGRETSVPRTTRFGSSLLYRTDEPLLVEAPGNRTTVGDELVMVGGTLSRYVFVDAPEVLSVIDPSFVTTHGTWSEDDGLGHVINGPSYADYGVFLQDLRNRRGRTVVKVRWSTMGFEEKINLFFAGPDLESIFKDLTVRRVMDS